MHLPPESHVPELRAGAHRAAERKLVGRGPRPQHGGEQAQRVRAAAVLRVRRDDGGPGDGVPVGHPVEHRAGGVRGGAPAVHGDEVVAKDGVAGESGSFKEGGEDVTVDEAAVREGAEAGAGRDERGVGGDGERGRGGGGGERLEGAERGGEPARVVELEDGGVGALHLRPLAVGAGGGDRGAPRREGDTPPIHTQTAVSWL